MSAEFRKSAGYTTPAICYKSMGAVSPLTGVASMNRVYSIQRVNKNYTGNIINLRRSSDSVNVDFVTDSTNTNLVTASGAQTLSSWLGAGTANAVIWYDQSGNGRNLVQTTNARQPGYSATTGVQFRSLLYMAFPDNCSITNGTILTGFIQNAYLTGSPASQWYFQDGIIPCELPGGANDWGLLLNGSGKFGVGTGPSDVACSISTNGLGTYSLMTVTRVSSTGAITLYNGTGTGSAFTLDTGSKAGTTPSYMGYNQPGDGQYMNADMASLFWFDDVKSGAFISSVASTFTTPVVPNLDVSGTGIVSLTGKSLFSQLPTVTVNSVTAAYSLRAVNGTTAKAVQVSKTVAGAPTTVTNWPPIAFTGPTSSTAYGTFTASASSIYSAGYEAYLAFNKITNDTGGSGKSWVTNQSTTYNTNGIVGEWLQLQCPVALTLSTMILYGRTTDYGQNTTQIYLFGSNDGSTWTQLLGASATGLQSVGGGPTSFTVNAGAGYTYFRVVCTQPTGAALVAIGEMFVTGTIPNQTSSTQDFYADRLGNLLTAPVTGQTLASWLGGATGYVTTWYDQSGLGNHATQTTAAAQPQIKVGTKLTKYCLVYSGAQVINGFSYTLLNGTKYTVCAVERRTAISGTGNNGNNTTDNPIWSCGIDPGVASYPHYTWRNTNTLFYGQYGNDLGAISSSSFLSSSTEPVRSHFSMVSSTSGAKVYIYNDPLSSPILVQNNGLTTLPNMFGGQFVIGFNNFYPGQGSLPSATGMYYIGEMYEFIIFNNSLYDIDTTTSITTISSNQIAYYV
jgi:hypothetical protein